MKSNTVQSPASPRISFIVPVYGVEEYLPKCLDSIMEQTFPYWECILIDDGSPDNCGQICDSYTNRDDRFKVIHKKNAGVSAARNDGIAVARGEWAYFVDSDDWLELDAAEWLYAAAVATGVDCVMSHCEYGVPEEGLKRSAPFSKEFLANTPEEIEELQKYILYQRYSRYYTSETQVGFCEPWGKFVRLAILKENGVHFDPYLNGVFDDGLYSLWLLEYCNSLYYLHKKTYNYRIVSNSLTHKFKLDAMETQRRGYERIEDFMRMTDKSPDFWRAYYSHVVRFLGGYLSRYYYNPDNPKSLRERNAELKRDLQSEPFRSAARSVMLSELNIKDKWLAICERAKWLPGLKIYLFAKRILEARGLR